MRLFKRKPEPRWIYVAEAVDVTPDPERNVTKVKYRVRAIENPKWRGNY